MPVRYIVIITISCSIGLATKTRENTARTYPVLWESLEFVSNLGKAHHVAPHMGCDGDEN